MRPSILKQIPLGHARLLDNNPSGRRLVGIAASIILSAALTASCGDDAEEGPSIDLVVYTTEGTMIPPAPGLATIRVTAVERTTGAVLTMQDFDYANGGGGLDAIPFGEGLQVVVEGLDATDVSLLRGMTTPFTFRPESASLQLPVFISPINSFSPATALRNDGVGGLAPQEVRFQREARSGHSHVVLPDSGLVIFTGGATLGSTGTELAGLPGGLRISEVVSAVEIYDPTTGLFTERPGMVFPRAFHTTTLLDDGRVLVSGGITLIQKDDGSTVAETLASGEIFDPNNPTQPWQLIVGSAAGLAEGRAFHSATLRRTDGRVVLIGGRRIAGGEDEYLATAEIFDPDTNAFMRNPGEEEIAMEAPRSDHTAVLLGTGLGAGSTILVIGGRNADGVLGTTEALRIVGTEGTKSAFSAGPRLDTPRYGHASLRASPEGGKFIVALGGFDGNGDPLSSVELLDAAGGGNAFVQVEQLSSPRGFVRVAELRQTNEIVVLGGIGANGPEGAADRLVFQKPDTYIARSVEDTMQAPRYLHDVTLLHNGLLLITGGNNNAESLDQAEFYNPDDGPPGFDIENPGFL